MNSTIKLKRFLVISLTALATLITSTTGAAALPDNFHPGYILSLQNDTVIGYIFSKTGNSSYYVCSFIPKPGAPVEEFGPMDIKGYGIGNDLVFHSVALDLKVFADNITVFDIQQLQGDENAISILHQIQNPAGISSEEREILLQTPEGQSPLKQPMFLKVIAEGYLSLLAWDAVIFARKGGNDEIHLLRYYYREIHEPNRTYSQRVNEYRNVLGFLTADCPAAYKRIAKTRYNVADLVKIVRIYNDCSGYDTWISGDNLPWLVISPGISLIAGNTGLGLKSNKRNFDQSDIVSQRTNTISPGIVLGFEIPMLSRKTSMMAAFHYYAATWGEYEYPNLIGLVGERRLLFTFSQSYLKIPLTIHYNLMPSTWSPSLVAGLAFNFTLKDDYTYITQHTDNDTGQPVNFQNPDFHLTRAVNPGILLGFNVKRKMGSASYLSAGLTYERAQSMFKLSRLSEDYLPFSEYSTLDFLNLNVAWTFSLLR